MVSFGCGLYVHEMNLSLGFMACSLAVGSVMRNEAGKKAVISLLFDSKDMHCHDQRLVPAEHDAI